MVNGPIDRTLQKPVVMKKVALYISILLVTAAVSASCWQTDQDWSSCQPDCTPPSENLVLKFRVQNVPYSEIDEYIDKVDVFLFDAQRNYLETRQVSESEDGGLTASFTLAPGTYHVVCWGNLNGNSRRCNMDKKSNFENSFVEIASTETGDPVYYTPYRTSLVRSSGGDYDIYTVKVLPGTRTVKELVFVKVHRKVELFISGYSPATRGGGGPIVEHRGAVGRFDFLLQRQCSGITLKRPSLQRVVNGEDMFTADITSKLAPLTDSDQVCVYNPDTGELATTLNLEQFVEENRIADTSYIPIHVVFGLNADVSVTVPEWMANEITWTDK
jgi:hypothetical protein